MGQKQFSGKDETPEDTLLSTLSGYASATGFLSEVLLAPPSALPGYAPAPALSRITAPASLPALAGYASATYLIS